ncbi:amidohydrolase family protein, partial [Kitasatospora sp. NPDC002965]|uniref:amidohydrolase family protein n=1 Tax=Kitasatospora sp. NPDC002965 TaxID=3154775 RepID=UPI0033A1B5D7
AVNGLTLNQAVESLSTVPARLLGLADSVGTLEPGKNADLVVLDSATHDLVAVMRRGEWITGADRFGVVESSMFGPVEGSVRSGGERPDRPRK